MKILQVAVEHQRWDLAAHAIVLAAARVAREEVNKNGRKNQKEKGSSKR